MNINEIISSGLLESYILGTASESETALVMELCKKHPELIKEIEAIEASLIEYSAQQSIPLNPKLKNKIAAKIFTEKAGTPVNEKDQPSDAAKIIPIQQNKLKLYKFGLAASLLLFVTSFFYTVILQQKVTQLHNEVAELSASRSYMADELKIQQTSLSAVNTELQIISDPNNKKITLKGMNSLYANSASIHWNTVTNEVYFNASALPAPANKQYQLWAIVGGKPVDAGMIDLNDTTVFQKMKNIAGAQAFAVTIEAPGGAATPSLETMCLLGNV